jgi:hypothetical protein
MKANYRFISQPPEFWAYVRLLSQSVGYKERGADRVKAIDRGEIVRALEKDQFGCQGILGENGDCTPLGTVILAYFEYRARVLKQFVEPRLMDADKARTEFEKLRDQLHPACPLPMNKQRGDKKAPAYFTGIINMLVEANCRGLACDYDPRSLTVVTSNGLPIRTLSRRFDGAFTSTVDPVAVWEIKEYYYTTTFGSRIADAVYESQLDGMELMELRKAENIQIDHYLFVDSRSTWWVQGKSYLCRLIDLLNMGLVEEVVFGSEVIQRLPQLAARWADRVANQHP